MRVLVLCNDFYHPGEVIERGLAGLGTDDYQFDCYQDMSQFKSEMLSEYTIVMLAKSDEISASNRKSWLTSDVQRAFVNFVEQGGALFVVHAGIVACNHAPILKKLVGSSFNYHPEPNLVSIYSAENVKASSEFTVYDEHYFIDYLDEASAVFLLSRSDEGEQVAGYRKNVGLGKVTVLSPGHYLSVWETSAFLSLIKEQLDWCQS